MWCIIVDMDRLRSIGYAAKRIGVTVKTLQRWDKKGLLPATRTLTGKRMYSDAQINALVNGECDFPHEHRGDASAI